MNTLVIGLNAPFYLSLLAAVLVLYLCYQLATERRCVAW